MADGIAIETHIVMGLMIEAVDRCFQVAKSQALEERAIAAIKNLRKALGDAKEVFDRDVARQLPEATGNGWRLAPKLYFAANTLAPAEIAALLEFEGRVRQLGIDPARRKAELPIRIFSRELAPVRDTGIAEAMAIRPGVINAGTMIADLSRHLAAVAGAFQPAQHGDQAAYKEPTALRLAGGGREK